MTQLYRPKSTIATTVSASDRQLFFWGWMRWEALTAGERFVCAFIILIPVLWVVGIYKYMTSLLIVCIAAYEWWKHGEIRLKPPITAVVAVFIFCIYRIAQMLINFDAPNKGSISGLLITWFSYALLLWYIQSNNVRLRLEAIAWACTVSIVQMLGFWLLLQYVLPISLFQPPSIPNLFGLVTGKAAGENLFYQVIEAKTNPKHGTSTSTQSESGRPRQRGSSSRPWNHRQICELGINDDISLPQV